METASGNGKRQGRSTTRGRCWSRCPPARIVARNTVVGYRRDGNALVAVIDRRAIPIYAADGTVQAVSTWPLAPGRERAGSLRRRPDRPGRVDAAARRG